MSNSSSTTDATTGQRAFYGEPQHEDCHVDDRDIFCNGDERVDERSLFVQTSHYLVTTDDEFTPVEQTQRTAGVA
ncbi:MULTISPECIES: hypothetical protein [Haloferax]|uniref:Uncharacterized protein n=2 Tax=Haloferax TaxID=2251 RepID=A0A6G1YZS5_9EURY|nr:MULTISPECIES: hypothetical protein [Haloferax]KAB1187145.1 hypothetical protein Hfx1149_03505 [Haloferax sp. CBA1149]MRW79782.1 hypothetical protein [Haloferax marinisediminis]